MLLATVFAFAQTAAPPPVFDEHRLVRRWLIQKYAEASSLLDDMQRGAEAAVRRASEPQTGMALRVVDLGGRPPWRAIRVANILAGSSADDAGIRAGDRIVMVGREWLDHEDARAFALYQSEYRGRLPLVIQRGDRLIRLRLQKRHEPCIVAGYELAQHNAYIERIADLKAKLDGYREFLPQMKSQEGVNLAHSNLKLTLSVITALLETQSLRLGTALSLTCADGPRF